METAQKKPAPIQVPSIVTKWLREAFVLDPKGIVQKAKLYEAYEEFCRQQSLRPRPPNTFGKILRQIYPHIQTKRLGSHRCQVTYYEGLAFKGAVGEAPYPSTACVETDPRPQHLQHPQLQQQHTQHTQHAQHAQHAQHMQEALLQQQQQQQFQLQHHMQMQQLQLQFQQAAYISNNPGNGWAAVDHTMVPQPHHSPPPQPLSPRGGQQHNPHSPTLSPAAMSPVVSTPPAVQYGSVMPLQRLLPQEVQVVPQQPQFLFTQHWPAPLAQIDPIHPHLPLEVDPPPFHVKQEPEHDPFMRPQLQQLHHPHHHLHQHQQHQHQHAAYNGHFNPASTNMSHGMMDSNTTGHFLSDHSTTTHNPFMQNFKREEEIGGMMQLMQPGMLAGHYGGNNGDAMVADKGEEKETSWEQLGRFLKMEKTEDAEGFQDSPAASTMDVEAYPVVARTDSNNALCDRMFEEQCH